MVNLWLTGWLLNYEESEKALNPVCRTTKPASNWIGPTEPLSNHEILAFEINKIRKFKKQEN